jgi:hypothetical protein
MKPYAALNFCCDMCMVLCFAALVGAVVGLVLLLKSNPLGISLIVGGLAGAPVLAVASLAGKLLIDIHERQGP